MNYVRCHWALFEGEIIENLDKEINELCQVSLGFIRRRNHRKFRQRKLWMRRENMSKNWIVINIIFI